MVSGNIAQGSGRHNKEHQDLRKVEKLVEQGHQGKKKDTRARKDKTRTSLGGSSPSESSTVEIYSEI
jgi:hypothetical protein